MDIIGTIVANEGTVAQVMIVRTSACGHSCETCGACAGKEHIIIADNAMGLPIGSQVVVRVSDRVPLGLAFVVYILPIMLCIGFCLLSNVITQGQQVWPGAILGVIVSGLILYYMNRKKGEKTPDGRVIGRAK